MDPVEQALHVADNVVQPRLIRLPEDEAARRGLLTSSAD